MHVSYWPILLQKSPAPRPIVKTGNIRIRRVGFLNQNSLFGLDLEKVFCGPVPKIVLQQNRPNSDMGQPPNRAITQPLPVCYFDNLRCLVLSLRRGNETALQSRLRNGQNATP